ncbi:MAG: phosphatase PAP2 family protein [Asgard group archaeon]|nr:phosphatase PAP2 family protein [Asgard group archaeon]
MLRDWTFTFTNIQLSGLSTISYVFDFLFYSTVLILSATLGRTLPPRYHEFLLYDISLRFTYFPENAITIPIWLLVLISAGLPLLQFLAFSLLLPLPIKRRMWDFFAGSLCLLGAMATQLLATVLLKNITGLPRPDFIDRCEPMYQNIPITRLSHVGICTQPDWALVQEGFRTFPSGHLSTVFTGMTITSLNVAARLQTFDSRNNSFKVFLTLFPIFTAAFVASTRVSDNRHFLRDIIAGSILGTFVGASFYFQYHPSIFNLANAGRSFPPRRFGIQTFFQNVGGFWGLDGNTDRLLEDHELEQLSNEQLGAPVRVNSMADNIDAVNRLL